MALADLTPKAIASNIKNYRDAGLETGGKFSLAELLLEQQRRIVSPFPVIEVARFILQKSQSSPDNLVTYGEIWAHFRPGERWTGNSPRSQVGKALGRVIAYCVDHKLPILTALVVRGTPRTHSPEAIQNIYEVARSFGVMVGPEPKAFVLREQQNAMGVAAESLAE